MEKERLQKYIARSGHCSRRQADELISDGVSVKVNGVLAESGMKVDDSDEITIDGVPIGAVKEKVYIKLNKPTGYTCTSKRFKSEKNIYELLPQKVQEDHSVHIVGRLDKDSQGLVLLTNDGELTQELTHPSRGHEKKYVVTVRKKEGRDVGDIEDAFMAGMELEDIGDVRAKKIKHIGGDTFEVVLTQGKKRQIRMMFRAVGEHVMTLKRISIDNLKVGALKEGEWGYLSREEVRGLR